MASFLKPIATLGGAAAGTAVGGPLAGALIGAGANAVGNLPGMISGDTDIVGGLSNAAMGAGMGAIGGYGAEKAATDAAALKATEAANNNSLLAALTGDRPIPGIRGAYGPFKIGY